MGGTWYTVKTFLRDYDPNPYKPNPYSSPRHPNHHAYQWGPANAPAAAVSAPSLAITTRKDAPNDEDEEDSEAERDEDLLAEARRAAGRDPVTGRRVDSGLEVGASREGRKRRFLGRLKRKKNSVNGEGAASRAASTSRQNVGALPAGQGLQRNVSPSPSSSATASSAASQTYQPNPPVVQQTQTPRPDLGGYYAPPERQATEYYAPVVVDEAVQDGVRYRVVLR